ncbi:LysE family translocator [Jannaschia sp. W003]|uniref:LysE family translocator n=1 Tax=Jannaschia sp. W003 TaxID=2867012 RepID=UPI0021A63BAD|nr:LysE family translocator [Jannaschia sp. W003]UWQ22610.1 LysE family translocator [Jannaschia sp. W003]
MDPTLWIAFALASAALVAVPGPTVLLVAGYALSQGRRVAAASALGVALGDFAAMSASLAGLGALVMASAAAFTVLKWLGAAYLLWMGVRMWRSADGVEAEAPGAGRHVSPRAVFGHAAAVTALNPKGIVFFVAFVPQFVDPSAPLARQFAVLVATFVGIAALNALLWALLADRLRAGVRRPGALRWMTRGGGAALVAMAAATALARRA